MNENLLLKEIEDIRHELYELSKTYELNSNLMVERSKELDRLLNIYEEKYVEHSHKR